MSEKIIIGGKRKKLQLKFVYYTFIATECYHDIATKRKFVNFFLLRWIPSQKPNLRFRCDLSPPHVEAPAEM